MSTLSGGLDSQQVLTTSFDPLFDVLKVRNIGGSLFPDVYDAVSLTYVPSGNGVGDIQTMAFSLSNVVMATLTFTYDAQSRVINITRV